MKEKPRRSESEGIEGVITALGLSFTGPPASSRRPLADEAPGFKKAYKMLCNFQHTKTHTRTHKQYPLAFVLQRERSFPRVQIREHQRGGRETQSDEVEEEEEGGKEEGREEEGRREG